MKRISSILLSIAILFLLAVPVFADGEADPGIRTIHLTGNGADFSCAGVSADGSVITISESGEYLITGTLNDGRIIINTGASEEKTLVTFSGVSITCLSDSAIYVSQAEKVNFYMAEGTENVITSGTEEMIASFSKDNTGAAIYAEDDIDIKGPGVLLVNGYINNGITCKDDIDIDGGTLIVNAVNNGIRGSESIEINDGNLTVKCGNDALKATSSKVDKGYVEIDGGKVYLQADGNGISAASDVTVYGGETVIESKKTPVKAKGNIAVTGGSLIANGVAL